MASRKTRSGTPRLSDLARHVVAPSGIASTGWPAIRDTCAERLGVTFDPWQDGAGRLIMAKRRNGKLAAMVGGVGMSLPRQVGKTYLLSGLVFALCITRPGLLVIWTAHHGKTHAETFLSMQAFAKRSQVAPYIARGPRGPQVYTGSGDEEIRFANGSRILFGAREHGFGRGIPGVDVLVMDEAQILSDRALDAMLATMNTSRFGLALYIGTPPRPGDNSEAFRRMRTDALSGESDDTAWIEFGADPGCSPADPKQRKKANPTYLQRTPKESLDRLQRKLTEASFLREGMGVWDDDRAATVFGAAWSLCQSPMPDGLQVSALAIAATMDLDRAAIVAAAATDERVYVKPLRSGPGTGWAVEHAKELQGRHDADVVIDPKGPAALLIPALEREGVRLRIVKSEDVYDACAGILESVKSIRLAHEAYPELDREVEVAAKRAVRDRWAWDRRPGIPNLEAATLAAWAAQNPGEQMASAYESRGVATV